MFYHVQASCLIICLNSYCFNHIIAMKILHSCQLNLKLNFYNVKPILKLTADPSKIDSCNVVMLGVIMLSSGEQHRA